MMGAVPAAPPDPSAELRQRLRDMRDAAGLSQGEIGVRLGRDQSWASRVERGSAIELHEIEAWARECGTGLRIEWGERDQVARVAVPAERAGTLERLARLHPADLELLERAAELLEAAPTARDRLAFEVGMWAREARAASVTATVAAVAAQIGSALSGGDAEAMRLLQERLGLTVAGPAGAKRAQ